jgi:hypothetical protein
MKDVNRMFGMTASDIDKYSRVIFPVTFTCFQVPNFVHHRFSESGLSEVAPRGKVVLQG